MSLSEVLQSARAFESFEEPLLEALERAMVGEVYEDGDVLIREGEHGDTFYVIVQGKVRVTRKRADGEVMELGTMETGEVFGLVALIDNQRRSATCTAVGHVAVATLPRGAFTLLYKGDTRFAYQFQHMIARQLVRDARALNEALLGAMVSGQEARPITEPHSLSYDLHLTAKE
jgi:CRP-like cAMP-binding protein